MKKEERKERKGNKRERKEIICSHGQKFCLTSIGSELFVQHLLLNCNWDTGVYI